MLEKGNGVQKNFKEALKWYKLAAEQGNSSGQFATGALYSSGNLGSRDYNEATKWWNLAAKQGDIDSQIMLGLMYEIGWDGVPGDLEESFKWYKLAAEQGNAQAQAEVGYMYYLGSGVRINWKQALYWGTLAETQGHKFEEEYLSSVKRGIKSMTTKELKEFEKTMGEHKKKILPD